jgi:hypothetical protein
MKTQGPKSSRGSARSQPGRPGRRGSFASGPSRRPAPPKLYRIGEIVEHTGVSRQTIHNYTTMGLITEARRTAGGHRLYDEAVFVRLELIAQLKHQNSSMRDIRQHFARLDANP